MVPAAGGDNPLGQHPEMAADRIERHQPVSPSFEAEGAIEKGKRQAGDPEPVFRGLRSGAYAEGAPDPSRQGLTRRVVQERGPGQGAGGTGAGGQREEDGFEIAGTPGVERPSGPGSEVVLHGRQERHDDADGLFGPSQEVPCGESQFPVHHGGEGPSALPWMEMDG